MSYLSLLATTVKQPTHPPTHPHPPRCSIYEARPLQCRTYPYWPRVMWAREAWVNETVLMDGEEERVVDGRRITTRWNQEDGGCEGIEKEDAPVVEFNTVRLNLLMQLNYNRGVPGERKA